MTTEKAKFKSRINESRIRALVCTVEFELRLSDGADLRDAYNDLDMIIESIESSGYFLNKAVTFELDD